VYVVREATDEEVEVLRALADYQFGLGVGAAVIPARPLLRVSRRTGRVRAVIDPVEGVVFTVRASTYTLVPTVLGATRLHRALPFPRLRCVVVNEVADEVVARRSTVFSRHVLLIDESLRPGDEVLVVDESDRLLCVGTLRLSPAEVMEFIRGAAIRVRACVVG
jgi:predicted RNA-binding protein (TIGR00451 family)